LDLIETRNETCHRGGGEEGARTLNTTKGRCHISRRGPDLNKNGKKAPVKNRNFVEQKTVGGKWVSMAAEKKKGVRCGARVEPWKKGGVGAKGGIKF